MLVLTRFVQHTHKVGHEFSALYFYHRYTSLHSFTKPPDIVKKPFLATAPLLAEGPAKFSSVVWFFICYSCFFELRVSNIPLILSNNSLVGFMLSVSSSLTIETTSDLLIEGAIGGLVAVLML